MSNVDTLHPYPSLAGKRVARTLPTTVCRATWIDLAPSKRDAPHLVSASRRCSQRHLTWESYTRLLERFALPASHVSQARTGSPLTDSRNLGRNRVRAGRTL